MSWDSNLCNIESYDIGSNLLQLDKTIELEDYFDEYRVYDKEQPVTLHTNIIFEAFNNQLGKGLRKENVADMPLAQSAERPNQIECSLHKLFKIEKSKRGRQNQIKNISQIFKSETCHFLDVLTQFHLIDQPERYKIKKFKQKSGSIKSFVELLKNKKIKQKLIDYYQCVELTKSVMSGKLLSFQRKLQVIKNFNTFAKILNEGLQ